jgi:hypothetical protein
MILILSLKCIRIGSRSIYRGHWARHGTLRLRRLVEESHLDGLFEVKCTEGGLVATIKPARENKKLCYLNTMRTYQK